MLVTRVCLPALKECALLHIMVMRNGNGQGNTYALYKNDTLGHGKAPDICAAIALLNGVI